MNINLIMLDNSDSMMNLNAKAQIESVFMTKNIGNILTYIYHKNIYLPDLHHVIP
jgi:hypothetical protein